MQRAMKMHLVGISLIVVVGALALITSVDVKPAAAPAPTDDGTITVAGATWGAECAREPKRVINTGGILPAEQPAATAAPATTPDATARFIPLKTDNVKETVAPACNGKTECEIPVSETTFGAPLERQCEPGLRVEYRCYHFGRLQRAEKLSGDTMKLSCQSAQPGGSAADAKTTP